MAKTSTSFQKGRPKTGGRQKGASNRRTEALMERMTALGCDPMRNRGFGNLRPFKKGQSPAKTANAEKPTENSGRNRGFGNLRPFKKGQSGNPGGRPKGQTELRSLAREFTEEAIAKAVEWMRSDDAAASLGGIKILLERGWGKPVQEINANNTNINITLSDTIQRAARFIEQRADELNGADRSLDAGSSAVRSNGGEEVRALANGGARGADD